MDVGIRGVGDGEKLSKDVVGLLKFELLVSYVRTISKTHLLIKKQDGPNARWFLAFSLVAP